MKVYKKNTHKEIGSSPSVSGHFSINRPQDEWNAPGTSSHTGTNSNNDETKTHISNTPSANAQVEDKSSRKIPKRAPIRLKHTTAAYDKYRSPLTRMKQVPPSAITLSTVTMPTQDAPLTRMKQVPPSAITLSTVTMPTQLAPRYVPTQVTINMAKSMLPDYSGGSKNIKSKFVGEASDIVITSLYSKWTDVKEALLNKFGDPRSEELLVNDLVTLTRMKQVPPSAITLSTVTMPTQLAPRYVPTQVTINMAKSMLPDYSGGSKNIKSKFVGEASDIVITSLYSKWTDVKEALLNKFGDPRSEELLVNDLVTYYQLDLATY
ncbi:hypothetical protein QE152_g29915 [Popillia japonica]|uniref:Uncharacterized protein n=1 Tax=Popillia japonica TaxID=7064 RepID=A0AAW1JHG0_POPJA